MKKLSLMVVGLLLTVLSYSQDFYRVVRATTMEYRDTNWVNLETQYPSDLFIIMKEYDVKIGTAKFRTYDAPEKTTYSDHITYSWECIDAEGINCVYMMKQFDKNITTHTHHIIMYANGRAWEYETE